MNPVSDRVNKQNSVSDHVDQIKTDSGRVDPRNPVLDPVNLRNLYSKHVDQIKAALDRVDQRNTVSDGVDQKICLQTEWTGESRNE